MCDWATETLLELEVDRIGDQELLGQRLLELGLAVNKGLLKSELGGKTQKKAVD